MDNHGPPAPVPDRSGAYPPSGPPRSPQSPTPPAATPAPPSPTLPGPPLNVGTAVEWALRAYVRRLGVLVALTALLVAPVTIATSLFADVPVAGNVVGTNGIVRTQCTGPKRLREVILEVTRLQNQPP